MGDDCIELLWFQSNNDSVQGFPRKFVPRLCVCYGGAIDSIILVFTQMHRLGFNLEFDALFESI